MKDWLGNKGNNVTVAAIHQWINSRYGKPKICEAVNCDGKSKVYDWALKKGKKYKKDRNNFYRLCRSCHRKYDLTPKKMETLWWGKSGSGEVPNRSSVIRIGKKEKYYSSMSEAARDVGCVVSAIHNCVKGISKKCAGYEWRRV